MQSGSRVLKAAAGLLLAALTACASPAPAAVQPSPRPASSATAAPSSTPIPLPSATLPAPTRPAPQSRAALLLAHYMPWYQSAEYSGTWGWHWTMNHFDPEQGQLAAHSAPLSGAYDSSDPAVLEYQLLLMKLAGIDGVIVDWYGSADFRDYAAINRATQALFAAVQKAGLTFAVCYEDQTLLHLVEEGRIPAQEAVAQGQADLRFLQENWFQDPAYLKVDGRPLLLVFGPQYFKDGGQWQELFAGIEPAPILVSEDQTVFGASESSYPWPPMSLARDGILSQAALERYLHDFYLLQSAQPYRLAGAFPGFDDLYQEAGGSAGYGVLAADEGETFRRTLESAVQTDPDAIQLITWNDYGEGTSIEPTEEYGYRYLEIVQEFRRQNIQPDFAFQPADLRLPLALYQRRKANPNAAGLAEISAALRAGDPAQARRLLGE